MTDDRLRELWAALPPSGEHPDEELWERLACGELPAPERERLLDHVVRCALCGRTYRAVTQVAAEARALDPSLRPARRRQAIWVAGSALLAAAAAVAIFFQVRPPPETLRGVPPPAIELVAPTVERVSWRPVAGADGYRARVLTEDGRLLFTSEGPATEATWPAAGGAPPGRVGWIVEALRGGEVIARSRVELVGDRR